MKKLLKSVLKKIKKYYKLKEQDREFLFKKISYLQTLNEGDKESFIQKIEDFINDHKFVDVRSEVTIEDKLLIAASIEMMLFRFKLDYNSIINTIYISDGPLKGDFYGEPTKEQGFLSLNKDMVDLHISRESLLYGYSNLEDGQNIGIHEFAHFIDGLDGKVDGEPLFILPEVEMNQWRKLSSNYMDMIRSNKTVFSKFAARNRSEFFAVASEYFFENPFEMKKSYPDLYEFLVKIYKNDLVENFDKNIK